MTQDEIDRIAQAAAEKAVKSMLSSMGINVSSPEALEEAQLDFKHLRAWRESTEEVKRKALLTAVSFLVTGFLGYLALIFFKGS